LSNSTAPTPTLEAEQDGAASCLPEPSINDLRKAAVQGSIAALSTLCSRVIGGVSEGVLAYDDGLSAAETYASLAAAGGGPAERWAYVSLLLHRAGDHKASGRQGAAEFYEREAARHLRKLHAGGDADALAALDELEGSEQIDAAAERVAEEIEATLARAASGDVGAIVSVLDGCLHGYTHQTIVPSHALAVSEELAWLAAYTGEPSLISKLAGVLALRGFYEWEHGEKNRGAVALCEAVGVALFALREGDDNMARLLPETLETLPPALLSIVIQAHPGALMFSAVKGNG
jgi:hypothetical protein